MSLRFNTSTTTNTKMDTAATNRNINLSVIIFVFRIKIQEPGVKTLKFNDWFFGSWFLTLGSVKRKDETDNTLFLVLLGSAHWDA